MRFCCGALWLEKPDKCFLSATVTQSRRLVGLEFSWPHLLHVSLGLHLCQSCAGNRIAPMQHEQLGLGTVLAQPQARDGVGPAVLGWSVGLISACASCQTYGPTYNHGCATYERVRASNLCSSYITSTISNTRRCYNTSYKNI